jgi:Uncharacterised nucleotidyltransferase
MSVRRQLEMLRTSTPRGPFPSLAWAWPTGERDLLLRAAILEDFDDAAAAYRQWESTYDFNDVDFARQRLLVAVSHRIPQSLLKAKDHPRLLGVERRLWTESITRLRTTEPALAALNAAGIDVMIFKGAVRTVLDISNLRGRYAAELDLLVRPQQFRAAWAALGGVGWTYVLGFEPDLGKMMGANLSKPNAGELDLHKYPYHQLLAADLHPDTLWSRAIKTSFLGQPAFIPSPTDRLLMAIGHGGIDGHVQSDWMVDCAIIIRSGEVDWPLFVSLARERRIDALAAIVLAYLEGPLGVAIGSGVLPELDRASRRHPFRLVSSILQSRPKREHSPLSAVGRGAARAIRMAKKAAMIRKLEAGL